MIEKKGDDLPNIPYNPADPRQFLPEDVNRAVEVGDLNGDGINDVVYLTEKGTYIMLTDSSSGNTNRYHPPVLLSNTVDDITDVVTLDYNKDGAPDLVLLTRDEDTPNRIYYGDSRDPTMKNLGQKEHAAGVTENGVVGVILYLGVVYSRAIAGADSDPSNTPKEQSSGWYFMFVTLKLLETSVESVPLAVVVVAAIVAGGGTGSVLL